MVLSTVQTDQTKIWFILKFKIDSNYVVFDKN